MSWFSNQWNRWNNSFPSAWRDVEWLEVVYGRQRYQVKLPDTQAQLTLGDLRAELAAVFSVPPARVRIVFEGLLLKDDRVTLVEYGLTTGSRIVLTVDEPKKAPGTRHAQAAGRHTRGKSSGAPPFVPHDAQGDVAAQAPAQGGPSVPPGFMSAPGFGGGTPAAAEPPAAEPPAAEPPAAEPAAPAPTPEEEALGGVDKVVTRCRGELVPELEQFEQTIAALPVAAPGTVPGDVVPGAGLLLPKRIPITQRKLSEYFLRELLGLDSIAVVSDTVRASRKSAVKEIQGYLDRVDGAWRTATEQKGIVNDI